MKRILLTLASLVLSFGVMAQNTKTLPDNVSVKTLDGRTVHTSVIQNEGKPIIISFWATWCKPCNRELNTIKEVYEEWQEETGVKLVAVSIDDSRSASRVKQLGLRDLPRPKPRLQACHECGKCSPHICHQWQRRDSMGTYLICGRQ